MTLSPRVLLGNKRLIAARGTETTTACSVPAPRSLPAPERNSGALQNIYLRPALWQDPLIAEHREPCVGGLTSAMQIHAVRGALGRARGWMNLWGQEPHSGATISPWCDAERPGRGCFNTLFSRLFSSSLSIKHLLVKTHYCPPTSI